MDWMRCAVKAQRHPLVQASETGTVCTAWHAESEAQAARRGVGGDEVLGGGGGGGVVMEGGGWADGWDGRAAMVDGDGVWIERLTCLRERGRGSERLVVSSLLLLAFTRRHAVAAGVRAACYNIIWTRMRDGANRGLVRCVYGRAPEVAAVACLSRIDCHGRARRLFARRLSPAAMQLAG